MKLRYLALAAAVAALSACNKDAGPAAAPPAVPVSVVQVAPREVPVVFEAVGRTEGSREVQVRARVAGILERQLYSEGDAVKAGAPLFRIERAPFEIDLAQQRAALAQEAARNELAKRDYERAKDLVARRFVSQQNLDQATSTLAQSNAAVQLAQARVRQSELNLSYTSVDAPIAGVTGRAQQSIGSLLSPNADSSLLTTLTRTDPLWVRFALSVPGVHAICTPGDLGVLRTALSAAAAFTTSISTRVGKKSRISSANSGCLETYSVNAGRSPRR